MKAGVFLFFNYSVFAYKFVKGVSGVHSTKYLSKSKGLSSDTGKRYTAATTSKTAPQTPAMILAFFAHFYTFTSPARIFL